MDSSDLASLFIVSQVNLTVGDALSVSVDHAEGGKCLRCWTHSASVGSDSTYPDLCARCARVLHAAQF